MNKYYSQQLDFVKTIAIILVIACHFFPGQQDWHLKVLPPGWFEAYWFSAQADIGHFLVSYSYLGVNLFVITSGFGLYLSHLKSGKPLELRDFFIKRVLRLLPAAVFSILVIFFIKGFFLDQWITHDVSVNFFPFFGGLNLFSDGWFFPPVNGETWFLGLIIQLYLFFPLLVKLYEKVGQKRFLLMMFLISVAFRALYFVFWKDSIATLSYGLSLGRLFEFAFGMVAAKKFVHGQTLSRYWLFGFAFVLGYFWTWTFPFTDALLGVALFVSLWMIASWLIKFSWWRKSGVASIVGKMALQSYFIFLLHHPFIWIMEKHGLHAELSAFGVLLFALFCIFSYWLAKSAQLVLDGITKSFKKLRTAHGNN